MICLDTYALAEIAEGNPKFLKLLDKDFAITDITLAEFYGILFRDLDEHTANYWYKNMGPYSKPVDKLILVKAVKYRYQNKEKNLSFFDCTGYIFARENNMKFVTGDKEFEKLPDVVFMKS